MKTVNVSEFKTKCLRFIDEVADIRESIIITKHGKPIVQLISYHQKPTSFFGLHRGVIKSHDDLTGSLNEIWDADR